MEKEEKHTWDNSTSMWWMRPDQRCILIKGILPRQKNPPTLECQKKISLNLLSNRFWHPLPPKVLKNTTSRASKKTHAENSSLLPVATPKKKTHNRAKRALPLAIPKKKTHNRAKRAKPQKLEVFSAEGRIVPKVNNPTKDGPPFEIGQTIIHSESHIHGVVSVIKMVDFKYMAQMNWNGCAPNQNESFYECDKLEDMGALASPRTNRRKPDFFTNHF